MLEFAEIADDPSTYFGNKLVHVEDNQLVSQYPLTAMGRPRVPLRLPCPAALRITAEFAFERRRSPEFGFAILADDQQGQRADIEFIIQRQFNRVRSGLNEESDWAEAVPSAAVQFEQLWQAETAASLPLDHQLTFSPDGQFLAFAAGRTELQIAKAATGEIVHKIDGLTDAGFAIAFAEKHPGAIGQPENLNPLTNPHYELVVISRAPLRLSTFHASGERSPETAHGGLNVKFFDLHPVSRLTAFWSDQSLHCVSWEDPDVRRRLPMSENILRASFSPDGSQIAFLTQSGEVRLWNCSEDDSSLLGRVKRIPRLVAFSGDGARIVAGWEDRSYRMELFDASTLLHLASIRPNCSPGKLVSSQLDGLSFGTNGGALINCFDDNFQSIGKLSFDKAARISDVAISPQAKSVAARDSAGRVHVFKVVREAMRGNSPASADHVFVASIRRAGVAIRSQPLLSLPDTGKLTLTCVRDGRHLQLRVENAAPLEVDDPFLHSFGSASALAIDFPNDTRLTGLRLQEREPPPVPTLLEQADVAYQSQDYESALELFRRQLQQRDRSVLRECRYKTALCLLATNQLQAGEAELRELCGQEADEWTRASHVQLWLHAFRRGKLDAAALAFAEVRQHYEFRELIPLFSEADRHRILDSVPAIGEVFSLNTILKYDPHRTERLTQGLGILDYMARADHDHTAESKARYLRIWLSRSYQMDDNIPAALPINKALFEAALNNAAIGEEALAWAFEEYSRLLRQRGHHEHAINVVARTVLNQGLKNPAALDRIALEQARTMAAYRPPRLAAAATVLKRRFFGAESSASVQLQLGALLLQGAIHEQMGETELAQQVWRRGSTLFDETLQRQSSKNHGNILRGMMMKARTGQLSREEFAAISELFLDSKDRTSFAPFAVSAATAIGSMDFGRAFTRAWDSADGAEDFWRMARDDFSLPDRYRIPLVRLAVELVDQSAFGEKASPDERQIIKNLMNDGYHEAVRTNTVGLSLGTQLLLAWKQPALFWATLKRSLDGHPTLAGSASYVLGMRFLTKRDSKTARDAFQNAVRLAEPNSLLARLSSARLQELSP